MRGIDGCVRRSREGKLGRRVGVARGESRGGGEVGESMRGGGERGGMGGDGVRDEDEKERGGDWGGGEIMGSGWGVGRLGMRGGGRGRGGDGGMGSVMCA